MPDRLTPDYPPVWLAGFALLAYVGGKIFPVHNPLMALGGWGLILSGALMMLIAAAQMLAARSTLDPHGQPRTLLTSGLYAMSRNPIYLADLLLLAGACLLLGAVWALPLVLVLMAVLTRRFILPEEQRLARLFPRDWPAYRQQTRRWL
ncbi:MAG: isoprenylcysteine carboxylmethyltransferase family protein [Paracoccus sp. (in: a-proteobacteria)]|uniref:methyltransferase family protein n=1 Tax=Paracoccus sp. TaxID=267 RepID=UPI0026DFE25F|nr:isoprenylcysteine carboxylmethyltransferase family protein [Paracoccus sp. (in: a-proteobacteria)]MDO5621050.1 isoprenylcysteine carboxylmethyltransferase family protein [Paracoccus sp. (in: a-proteobacteria)]